MKYFFIIFLLVPCLSVSSQGKLQLSGVVVDDQNQPIIGAHVLLDSTITISNENGEFNFTDLTPGTYQIKCNFIGYQTYTNQLLLVSDTLIRIRMQDDIVALREILIQDKKGEDFLTLKSEYISSGIILEKYSGSLAKTLESLAGVNAMDIGASMSKPVIRGMGFNRIVVAENGIKQEGQQWGSDHGLEIDPFSVENAEIIKGASSIEYGSDAIGGVINVENTKIPEKNSTSGEVSILAKSVNHTFGGSVSGQTRSDRLYLKFRGTYLDFGDYSLPVKSINYLNTIIPIYNNRLKNTAGKEKDFNFTGGYLSNHFRSSISLSHVDQSNGFFPGSHGIPNIDRVLDDGNRRNIDFPHQHTRHLKIISNNIWVFGENDLHLDVGYQKNHRQEWSKFHTHYSSQSPPENNPDLELDLQLSTYSINTKFHYHLNSKHQLTVGTQTQHQENEIKGYNYFLPAFKRTNSGVFLKNRFLASDKMKFSFGVRYDWGETVIQGYFDSLLYHDLQIRGLGERADFYANRGMAVNWNGGDVSWLAGMEFTFHPDWKFTTNVGSSFRMPLALELGANGIHHGSFRHEVGNPSLDSEKGIYFDLSLAYNTDNINFSINPYLYHFSNYVYLDPTGQWSFLAHAGQIYEFTQAKVLLAGIELSLSKTFAQRLSLSGNFEHIFNRQLDGESKNFSLPYTPPTNGYGELEYAFGSLSDHQNLYSIFINSRIALTQNQLAKNELSTPGYQTYGAGLKSEVNLIGSKMNIIFQVHNIFNTIYYNHISFYRKLEIPEPGRNFQMLINIPIQ